LSSSFATPASTLLWNLLTASSRSWKLTPMYDPTPTATAATTSRTPARALSLLILFATGIIAGSESLRCMLVPVQERGRERGRALVRYC